MVRLPHNLSRLIRDAAPFLKQLAELYRDMDRQYDVAATAYGFECRGCRDNCCRTRFYHHTHIEFFQLLAAFCRLPLEDRQAAVVRARQYDRGTEPEPAGGHAAIMCPLNVDEKCRLYDSRPMICRLHGLPHELRRPGADPVVSPGCGAFHERAGHGDYLPFDRTPLYVGMAQLERACKQSLQLTGKCRLTVAQMILAAAND